MVVALGVQVDGVEHRAVDVVLALACRRRCPCAPGASRQVALEVAQRRLSRRFRSPPMPYMICSVPSLLRVEVGEVLHEVVGLPVEVERVQAPQRERRVAHPAVAVVPVALAARRLRQRRRQRRDHRPGRRVGQALEHERRALQVLAPGMVGVGAGGQPLAPVVARSARCARSPRSSVARAAELLGPRQRAEAPLALAHRVARVRGVALDAHPQVAAAAARRSSPSVASRTKSGSSALRRSSRAGVAAVVEARRADQLDRDLALDALDRAHEQVVGVVVGRRARA